MLLFIGFIAVGLVVFFAFGTVLVKVEEAKAGPKKEPPYRPDPLSDIHKCAGCGKDLGPFSGYCAECREAE